MSSGTAIASEKETYGLLNIAGIELALPLSALREVVPCPDSFAALPVKAVGLVGAIELRRHIVPVLDLRPHLGIETADAAQVVIIITDGEHLLGLLANGLGGVTQLSSDDLLAVGSNTGPLFFSHTFRSLDVGGIVSVLNVDHILAIDGLPMVTDPGVNGGGTTSHARADAGEKFTLLEAGPYALALDIQHVHTTLPSVELLPSVIDSELCKGVTRYSGKLVPVIDPLEYLGLGRLASEQVSTGVVIKIGDGFVVLALSRLLDIIDLPASSLMSLPEFSFRRPDLFRGAARTESTQQCLVLNGNALTSERELSVYADLNTDDHTGSEPADNVLTIAAHTANAAASGDAQLVYSIGIDVATPLEQVSEILPIPEVIIPAPGETYAMGSMTHRDRVVPIVHLSDLVGRPADRELATCLLLVAVDDGHIAFAVDALRTIESLAWRDPDEKAPPSGPIGAIGVSPLVQVGSDSALIPQLDLSSLAKMLKH